MIVESTATWKILDFSLLIGIFLFNAILLDAEIQNILLAIGGSISGSIILAYYRRETSKVEIAFKVFVSSIGGLVLGTVSQTYLHVEHPSYVLGLFFLSSMLSLIILRTILTFTEQNAVEGLKTIVQKWIGVSIESKKKISENKRDIKQQGDRINQLEDKEK